MLFQKRERYHKKDVSTLTKAETLIKQNNCGTNVYYRFSNNTLTIFGKGAIKIALRKQQPIWILNVKLKIEYIKIYS